MLNRDNLFEEMLQEPDEIALKRKRARETLRVLQQAFRVSYSFAFIFWMDFNSDNLGLLENIFSSEGFQLMF